VTRNANTPYKACSHKLHDLTVCLSPSVGNLMKATNNPAVIIPCSPQEGTRHRGFGLVFAVLCAFFHPSCCFVSQIRSIKLDCRDAAGPVWARHLAMSLWRGEAFVLQIDSHMRFVSGWDDVLIHLLSACCHEKPVLSTYPPGYSLPDTVSIPISCVCWVHAGKLV
jgi:Glycosyltransferase (GlcNAc)